MKELIVSYFKKFPKGYSRGINNPSIYNNGQKIKIMILDTKLWAAVFDFIYKPQKPDESKADFITSISECWFNYYKLIFWMIWNII